MNATRIFTVLSFAIAATTIGCSSGAIVHSKRQPGVVVVKDTKGGPPPHAPAHGYRHKHRNDGVVLVYDSGIAVYAVSGYRDCYFNDGMYFRFSGGTWEMSARISGPWKVTVVDNVPSGLKVKYKGKHKSPKKSKKAK